jgi:hypothetical protein
LCYGRDWLAEIFGELAADEASTVQAAFDLLAGHADRG